MKTITITITVTEPQALMMLKAAQAAGLSLHDAIMQPPRLISPPDGAAKKNARENKGKQEK